MEQDLQFRMARGIPLLQRFRYTRRSSCYDKAALRRDVAAAHRGAMSDVWIALRKGGKIDFVEDGKARELRGGIGQRVWNPQSEEADEGKYFHDS